MISNIKVPISLIPLSFAVLGLLIGYFVLSPLSMYISHLVHMKMPIYNMSVWDVYNPKFYLWSLPFTLFSGLISLLIGILYYRVKRSEKDYRLVVENANEGIIVAQDGMLKFVNDAASRISGYSREELFSTPFMEFVHPEDRKIVKEHSIGSRGNEEPENYEMRIVNKKGDIIWLRNSSVIIEWDGKPATLNFLTDITKQKKAEENWKKAYEQLITNLQQFDKSADRLRNPLAVIMSSLEMIEDYGMNRFLKIVHEETNKLKKRLDELREEEIKTYSLVEPILDKKDRKG